MCATRSLRTDMFSHTRMKRGDAVRRTSLSLRKLPRQFFYLCTIRSPTYTEPRPTATGSVLRIGHNALDVLHVGTRAVHGFTHAHERVLAEVFRARNCYKHKKRKMSTRHGTTRVDGDISTYDCLRALPTVVGRWTVGVVVGVQTFR